MYNIEVKNMYLFIKIINSNANNNATKQITNSM